VEQFERIRREHRDEGRSIRELAKRHKVHRRTVRAALADAVPPARKVPQRAAAVLGVYEGTVRRWLTEDLDAPRKQRHTARRVWQRLIEQEGAVVAESSVRALVAQLKVEVGLTRRQVSVPQTHAPAEEAEVDFGEFTAVIAGTVMKVWMFVLRLSHSGKAIHIAYANQAQESFLDGHVQAFARLGGVPTGMVRYDNLKPAVIRCALGPERFEHPRFIAFRSHFGFELGADADLARGQTMSPLLDQLEDRNAELDADNNRLRQQVSHLDGQLRELTDTLDAARAMNREFMSKLNRDTPARTPSATV